MSGGSQAKAGNGTGRTQAKDGAGISGGSKALKKASHGKKFSYLFHLQTRVKRQFLMHFFFVPDYDGDDSSSGSSGMDLET